MDLFCKRPYLLVVLLMLTLFASLTHAQKATELYKLQVKNPDKSINYVVGDTFIRYLEIDIQQPYQLKEGSLPELGINHQGIELKSINLDSKNFLHSRHYSIMLEYQIFHSDAYTKQYKLQAHKIKIVDKNKSISITIPEWSFRVSPIATHAEGNILQDLSPYRAPLLVDPYFAKLVLAIFFSLTLISVLGLIYINADRTWFPGMGGPFSRSYRELQTIEDIQKALASVHHAFNKTYKESLFQHNLDDFLAAKPAFTPIRAEIFHFFSHSYHLQFGSNKESNTASLSDITQFCILCRHCERSI